MNKDSPALVEDHKEKKIPIFEVVNAEKLWWALMHSKGILHTEVQDLYRKARLGYAKIILHNHENVELQEVEYCLWKLHYKHIDEFRKRIRATSSNATILQNTIDIHTEGFKSFLYEATEFYKDLIIKARNCYKKDDGFDLSEASKHRFQYVHHRFLVCLGDLARYRELCKKPDLESRNWAVAANYYLQAATVCPDSGNPQNQLALLATYVDDDFLALYHCVRSLAVKEPFPDALDNLLLLFEKNRASYLPSLSSKAHFDYTKPSERICSTAESHERNDSSNNPETESNKTVLSGKVGFWPLFVRVISFFFVESSLEDFHFTFASTIRELESLLAVDDIQLQASLESYQQMDYARKGPYRALQVVSTLIFIIHKLAENLESSDQKEKNELALTATFIIMGRIIKRCNWPDCCRLLAAVLVFVEWLLGILDRLETYHADKKVARSMSYFFGAFVDLLNQLDTKDGGQANKNNALWEDYQLRGFMPVAQENILFGFSTNLDSLENYNVKDHTRVNRLFRAGTYITEKSQKWISFDKSRKKFYVAEMRKIEAESRGEGEVKCKHGYAKEYKNEESQSLDQSCVMAYPIAIEEEEVILFRPITRYNSAPISADELCAEDSTTKFPLSDERLRRASSLFDQQNRDQPNKSVNPPEPATHPPAGPPSLNAWVVNREGLKSTGKGTSEFCKHELTPIEEIDASIGSTHISGPTHDSPSYVAPAPSAPFLPDDASWFKENATIFPEKNRASGINEADGILGPSPLNRYPHWSPKPGHLDHSPDLKGLFNGFPPFSGMSSSEWLYNYQNSRNLERDGGNNNVWPIRGNFDGLDAFDRWGKPLVSNRTMYMEGPELFPGLGQINGVGYQRPSPYGCGAGTDLRAEQTQLLQYLKEREWKLQMEAQLRGPH